MLLGEYMCSREAAPTGGLNPEEIDVPRRMAETEDTFELHAGAWSEEEEELDPELLPQRPLGESDDEGGEEDGLAGARVGAAPSAAAASSQRSVPSSSEIGAVLHDVAVRVSTPASMQPVLATTSEFVAAFKATVAAARASVGALSKVAKGRFCILLITPSAPRAASLCGILSRSGVKVAKLFARHLTLDEQAAFLSTHDVDVAVGTPNRVARLAEGGMLDLASLRHVVVDVTPNAKAQTIFSPPGKGKARQPDAAELARMLTTAAFAARLKLKPPGAPQLCAVLLPDAAAVEAAVPVGVRMQGRGRGGKAKGDRQRGSGKGRPGRIRKQQRR